MSLKENQLGDHNAVFKEWIGKYSILKAYTQDGVPRQLTAIVFQVSIHRPATNKSRSGSTTSKNNVDAAGGRLTRIRLPGRLLRRPHLRFSLTRKTQKQIRLNCRRRSKILRIAAQLCFM